MFIISISFHNVLGIQLHPYLVFTIINKSKSTYISSLLFIYLSIYLSIYQSIYLSIYLSIFFLPSIFYSPGSYLLLILLSFFWVLMFLFLVSFCFLLLSFESLPTLTSPLKELAYIGLSGFISSTNLEFCKYYIIIIQLEISLSISNLAI